MKKYACIKYIFAIMSLILGCATVAAQDMTTPAARELYKQWSLWLQSTNAAGSLLDKPIDYVELKADYTLTDGGFHRPQQGREERNLGFYTEGGRTLTGFYAWGSFSYDRQTLHDANYNLSLADPYRNMPYYIVDTVESKWLRQNFDMNFRLTTLPLCNDRLILGVEGAYNAVSAAKQRDLRTMNRYMELEVRPGAVFSTAPSNSYTNVHTFGVNLEYRMLKEEANMSNVNPDDQLWYTHRGLGVADYHYSNPGRTTNYMGNSVGGGVQYHLSGRCFELLASANYLYKVEDVEVGYSESSPMGTVRDHLWQGRLMFRTKGFRVVHGLDLKYDDRNIDGIEYLTEYNADADPPVWEKVYSSVRSHYRIKTGEAAYSLVVKRGAEYSWKFDAAANYYKQDDEYILPKSVFQVENIAFSLGAKKNFVLSRSELLHRLLIAVGGTYGSNLDGIYDYNGPNPDHYTVTRLFPADLAYLMTDFYRIDGSVVYSQRINKNYKANLFAKIGYGYCKAIDSTDYNRRTGLVFSLGCNF